MSLNDNQFTFREGGQLAFCSDGHRAISYVSERGIVEDDPIDCPLCKFLKKDGLVAAWKSLLNFAPGMSPALIKQAKRDGYYQKGDENAPFFSEAYLYPLLGKDDARTILSIMRLIIKEQGVDSLTAYKSI